MDPLEQVIPEKDTSLALMVGAQRKGHQVYVLPDGGIVRHNNGLRFHVTHVNPHLRKNNPFEILGTTILNQDDVHVIFIRTDPPFDERYLLNTWLLDLLPSHIPVINAPAGIRTANEKIWVTQFISIIPDTVISCRKDVLLEFIHKEKTVIAKPTDGFGGQSVFKIRSSGSNVHALLEVMTRNGQKDIILQKYIPEAVSGDKRILLLDGEPLGAVLRLHAEDDHRNNFFAGGKPLSTGITKRDHEIIDTLRPELKKLGLYFVGIDIIGDYLIEVNVTSPTCLQEINRLEHVRLEDRVIAFSQNLIDLFATAPKITLWKE